MAVDARMSVDIPSEYTIDLILDGGVTLDGSLDIADGAIDLRGKVADVRDICGIIEILVDATTAHKRPFRSPAIRCRRIGACQSARPW